jgi:hypothetical protein
MSRAILKEIEACTNVTIARMANNTTATLTAVWGGGVVVFPADGAGISVNK